MRTLCLTLLALFCFVVAPCAFAGPVADRCASRYGYGGPAFRDCMRRHTPPPRDYRRGPGPGYRREVSQRCASRYGYGGRGYHSCMRRHSGGPYEPPPRRRW